MSVEQYQEETYDRHCDYRFGSPHLTHHKLTDRLIGLLRSAIAEPVKRGLPPRVLDVGAGDGAFTEPALASGYAVTATEVSRASIERLNGRFGTNPNFKAVHDPDGQLSILEGQRFSAIVGVAVLHHIPDYETFLLAAVSDHLEAGGSLLTMQDPMWYQAVGVSTRWFSRIAFYSWRITKGNFLRGVATTMRRLRGVYDDDKPGDVVEYHVVRQGVNHSLLAESLAGQFEAVTVVPYWSSQAAIWQRLGDVLGLKNTFALNAQNYLGPSGEVPSPPLDEDTE